VVDHGSDDGSTSHLRGANVIRIPRSPLDEIRRAEFLSRFCNSLLSWYDYVAYTDVDELLVADPRRHAGLISYCGAVTSDVTTALGMNVFEMPGDEPLDPSRPVSSQRRWARAFSFLCKPSLIRRPVQWGLGFHDADAPTEFDDLFLMHIAYSDFGVAARRQLKRRGTPRAPGGAGEHHSVAVEDMIEMVREETRIPRRDDVDLDTGCPARTAFIDRIMQNGVPFGSGRRLELGYNNDELWRIPSRFDGTF
jgi:hypothetical protein